ncbi:hypothetical protein QAD02_002203 [Eretmocerus hayati]|uniref:Uncharacterized protein n=1 Tax=Eretmocerus hayati TaxID=131215 RepID=A0ACC2NI78_9HYME|nr:hypothetical protein QAD02_002203 [Eretmocerus hayati]
MRYVTGRHDNYRNDRVPTRNYNGSRSTPNFYEPNDCRSYSNNFGYNNNDNRSRSFYNNNANQGRNYEGYNMNRNGNWNNGTGYRAPMRNNDDYNSQGYTQRYNSGNNGRQYNNARSNYNGQNGNYRGSRNDNGGGYMNQNDKRDRTPEVRSRANSQSNDGPETTRQIESSHVVDGSTTPIEIDELTINVSERMAIHPLSWNVKEFETQGQAGVQILIWGKGNEPKNGGSISNEEGTILINTKDDVEMPQVEISINPNDISQQQEALSNLPQPQNSSYRNGALANAGAIQGNMIQGNYIDRQDEESDITEAYAHLRTLAAMNLLQGKFRSERSYDLKINSKFFRVGEMVYLLKEPRHGKTDKHYVGPWEILEIDYNTHNARIIKDGTERIVHIDKLKNHHENEDAQ